MLLVSFSDSKCLELLITHLQAATDHAQRISGMPSAEGSCSNKIHGAAIRLHIMAAQEILVSRKVSMPIEFTENYEKKRSEYPSIDEQICAS